MRKIFLLIISFVILFNIFYTEERSTVQYYQDLVNSELKIGDSKEQIEAFFERHNFQYNFYDNSNNILTPYEKEPKRGYASFVYATQGRSLVKKTIQLRIGVDENKRVTGFFVEKFVTSL